MFNIIIETIATTTDNTFFGTLIAGFLIGYFGLWFYRKQKKIDINSTRNEKIHDLTLNLLTQVNIAVQDYLSQIDIYSGKNPAAKIIFNKMESISPGFASNEMLERFKKYISNITQALNDLSTPLAINDKNENRVKTLAENISSLNFLFSASSTLSKYHLRDLEQIKTSVLDYSNNTRMILEKIINS